MPLSSPASLYAKAEPSPARMAGTSLPLDMFAGIVCGAFWKAVWSRALRKRPFSSSSLDLDDKTHPSILLHFLEACRLARTLLAGNVIEMKGHNVPEHLGYPKQLQRPLCYQTCFYLLSPPPPSRSCPSNPLQEHEECPTPGGGKRGRYHVLTLTPNSRPG